METVVVQGNWSLLCREPTSGAYVSETAARTTVLDVCDKPTHKIGCECFPGDGNGHMIRADAPSGSFMFSVFGTTESGTESRQPPTAAGYAEG